MPSVRAPLRAVVALRPALSRIARIASVAVVTGFVLFALTLLVVRFIVFPRVDSYRDTLTSVLSQQFGQPVEIAALAAGWDGWNPKLVVEGFRVRDRNRDVVLLELPEVDLVVAWTSLPLLELRLKELAIERPRLAIRRDRAGMLHIAGLEFDPGHAVDDSPVTSWILRQREIVVRDALITWNDDLRNAPQLVLDRVQFRLQNRFGHHRFGLKGTPPAELAAPLDVRGDIRGGMPREWQQAQGQIYVRLDYADVGAWRDWLPLPADLRSGKGALRVWFQFGGGEAREIVADLELADVQAQLGDKLPELHLAHVSGRAGWRHDAARREFFTRDLAFVTAGGQRLDPTSLSVTLRDSGDGTAAAGQVEFDRMQVEPLRELAAHLPLPMEWRTDLARFAPRGTLSRGRFRWDGTLDSPSAFTATAEFADLGVVAQEGLPGASGLTGSLDASETRGELKLATRGGALEFHRLFAAPIPLDNLQGAVSWERKGGRTRVDVRTLEFANAHAAGSLTGTYRTLAEGPGEIDLLAQMSRADPEQVHRYLPLATGNLTREWLRTRLRGGTVSDVRAKVKGNLAHFPFADGKNGQFLVTAKAKGVTLDYAQAWPGLQDIDADVRFEGPGIAIDAARGHTFGIQLSRTRAVIPDLRAEHPQLSIDGGAAGPMADFLRFVEGSPVAGMIGHFTDGATGAGNGRLAFKLLLPLGWSEGDKVTGEFAFANAELQLPGVPKLSQVNGQLAFTESTVRSRDLAAETLGGTAKLAITSAEGRVRVTGGGTANLAVLRRDYATIAYLDRLSGTIEWTMAINVRPDASTWIVESSMKGVAVDLPVPLGKAAAEAVPLRVERRAETAQADEDRVDVTYGGVAQVAAHRKLGKSGATVDRLLLSLGRAAGRPDAARAERPGIWVRAELPTLNIDDWLALRDRAADAGAADGMPPLGGMDLDVGVLDAFGRQLNELKVVARRSQNDWKLDLSGREIAGTAAWSGPGSGAPNGRVVARLARFTLPAPSALPPHGSADKGGTPALVGAANPWPEIDIAADSFSSKGRDLGRLELIAQPRGAEWRIEKLVLANDSGRIDADGVWRGSGRTQQTRLDVALDAKDAGGFLTRFGSPGCVAGRADEDQRPARVVRRAVRIRLPDTRGQLAARRRARPFHEN